MHLIKWSQKWQAEGGKKDQVVAVSFLSIEQHRTHPSRHSPSGLQWRPMNHQRFWLGSPWWTRSAPVLQLRNLGLQSTVSIKAIYKLSLQLWPSRRCLAPDPFAFYRPCFNCRVNIWVSHMQSRGVGWGAWPSCSRRCGWGERKEEVKKKEKEKWRMRGEVKRFQSGCKRNFFYVMLIQHILKI